MENVDIKSDKIRAFRRSLPLILAFAPYLAFGIYLKTLDNAACEFLFGFNVSYLSLISISYLLPMTFFIISFWVTARGYKILKYKYNPPLDTPVFRDTTATSGIGAILVGVIFALTPVYAIYLLHFGHTTYINIIDGRSYSELITNIEKGCK